MCHQLGWLGYSSEKVKSLCSKYLKQGFTGFKIKVGDNLEDDIKRCKLVRSVIGEDNNLVRNVPVCIIDLILGNNIIKYRYTHTIQEKIIS